MHLVLVHIDTACFSLSASHKNSIQTFSFVAVRYPIKNVNKNLVYCLLYDSTFKCIYWNFVGYMTMAILGYVF